MSHGTMSPEYTLAITSECASVRATDYPGPSVAAEPTPQARIIPTIVITPVDSQPPEKSSWVPIQDTCFGARLTVPTHSALNAAHPPMVLPSYAFIPLQSFVRWTYKFGHWCAVPPGLDEQDRKGIFSRPVGIRRRTSLGSMRKRMARDPSHSSRQNSFGRNKRDS